MIGEKLLEMAIVVVEVIVIVIVTATVQRNYCFLKVNWKLNLFPVSLME